MERKENLPINQEITLNNLTINKEGIVTSLFNDNMALRKRLLDMGITNGVLIKIKKIAPLGDPVCLELRGYQLCLRKKDLEKILVKVV